MKNKKKINSTKVLILLLIIAIIICLVVVVKKGSSEENLQENNEQSNNIANNEDEKNTEENNEDSQEVSSKPIETEKTSNLNNLAENEASFGELEVPVYKKGEKELKIPLLIYHAFQTPIPESDKYKLFTCEENFEENVKTLLDAGYTFLTLEDIYKYNKGYIGLPEKNITITMDDGWLGCYTEAFNVLKKYNVPATIFIVENLVGTESYFSWKQAKEMYDTGLVKIHVHGKRHVEATGYSKEKLIEAYNSTHEMIEEKLGAKVQKIMAYPAGKSSENTIKWLKEAGFEIQVQTKYGTVNKSSTLDLTGLGRIRGERATGKSILNSIGKK